MIQSQTELDRTAKYWSAEGSWEMGRGLFWMELEAVQRRLNFKVSGQPDLDWVTYTVQTHLAARAPVERCLSLGCGQGNLERQLARLGAFQACEACDIADGSIRVAQEQAAAAGLTNVHYSVKDLNTISLPPQQYDMVVAAGAVHHVTNLEHLFEQIHRTLKPGGWLVLNEYVGPSRFQFPDRQRAAIEACHALLPAAQRTLSVAAAVHASAAEQNNDWRWYARRVVDKLRDGDLLDAVRRRLQRRRALRTGQAAVKLTPNLPTARSVAALDPSEAVRAAEIRGFVKQHFRVIDYKPLGGTILQFLLADIAGNFQTPDGQAWLDLLFAIEDQLISSGELDSDFVYLVAAA